MIDAKHGSKYLNETPSDPSTQINAALQQVALADVLILNKTDLVPDTTRLTGEIRSINDSAPLIPTQRSRIDLNLILDLHAYDGQGASPGKFASDLPPGAHIDFSVKTVTLEHPGRTTLAKLELFLQALLWDGDFSDSQGNKTEILRLKGLLPLEDRAKPVLVQGVHDTYDTYETEAQCDQCTMVLIGKHLNPEALRGAYKKALS